MLVVASQTIVQSPYWKFGTAIVKKIPDWFERIHSSYVTDYRKDSFRIKGLEIMVVVSRTFNHHLGTDIAKNINFWFVFTAVT